MLDAPRKPESALARLATPAILVGCLLGSWGSLTVYQRWASNRESLLRMLAEAGVTSETVLERVRREPVAHHAQLDTARALVFQLLAAPSVASLPEADREAARGERLERLVTAHELARQALGQQPNSWEASMLQGATTYLSWSLARDRRLFTESAAWQDPLIKAWREAPSQNEPRRILGTAYLELWPALSTEKRALAMELLATTFADDPQSFRRLGPVWLATADDTDLALSIVPDTPRAWEVTARYFAERQRWLRYRQAHLAGLDSLERHLNNLVDEGTLRLELGDVFHSRTRFARVIALAPPDHRFVPLINRALTAYPAGLQTAGTGTSMIDWLTWAIDLAEIGIPSLAPRVVDRLAGAVTTLSHPAAATAALVGGDLPLAERLEKLDREHSTASWAGYLTTKAHALLERGDVDAADATLVRVGSLYRASARYWQARVRIATLRDDPRALKRAQGRLDTLRSTTWPARAWSKVAGLQPPSVRLEILPAQAATGVAIDVANAPREGSVVRVRVDGHTRLIDVTEIGKTLVVDTPLEGGPHVLEWSTLAGGVAVPGDVRLLFPRAISRSNDLPSATTGDAPVAK